MTEGVDRLTAALADRYRIERELGAGGMATVYLAEDLKHDRKVALKVLKPELAAVLGADRFIQEIKTTASLQHPHILPLFDSGEADGFLFYVMPYIEGETLRDKLNRETQLSIDEAVGIACDVADALDYAHRQGVIHRDIKPENILLHDGRPVVADFGIALAVSAAAGGRMTETGLSLGTPHYMSPEQATAEKDLTNRADIYSLGAVLYEMLTGDPPHTGASAQQIIMKIVTEEAQPVTKARKSVPPHVAAAVAKALEKLSADRFGTAEALGHALRDTTFSTAAVSGGARDVSGRSWRRTSVVLAGVSLVLLVAVVVLAGRRAPAPPLDVSRFVVDLQGEPGAGVAAFRDQGPGIAITDDGGWLAYPGGAGSRTQILVRKRDRLGAEAVRSTGDVRCCLSFAPDGQSLAYITVPLELKVVSLAGGIVRVVADSGLQDPSLYGGGVDWGRDGLLYVSMVDGLWRLSPEGVEPERVTTTPAGVRTHAWVDVLPNARGALLTVIPSQSGDRTAYAIGVVDFATREVEVLFPGVFARYAASGHIVFVQDDGTLLVAPFDQDRLAVTGTPVAVLENVPVGRYGAVPLAMSASGTLVYRRAQRAVDRLVWVDRNGTMQGAVAPELDGVISTPRLSADGTRFVVSRNTGDGAHLWTRGVAGGEPVRHTFAGQLNWRVNWSPTGDSLYFISDRDDEASVFVKQVDGAGTPRRMPIPEERPIFEVLPVDDATVVVRTDNQAAGNGDILLVRLAADTTVAPLIATPAAELTPAVSPDGRWLAYTSDESGADEVYVRPFPDVNAGVYRVSTSGGTEPLWAHSGRELFYKNGDGELVVAAAETSPTFTVRSQQVLFSSVDYSSNLFAPEYAVSLDDRRFLMILREEPELANEVVVVLNWFEELRELDGRE
jgi:serine/threonine-protein kinase